MNRESILMYFFNLLIMIPCHGSALGVGAGREDKYWRCLFLNCDKQEMRKKKILNDYIFGFNNNAKTFS
jgi:hypothetical protein